MSFALRLAALGLICAAVVRTEWVEIPQFSDQQKVYRPVVKIGSEQQQQQTDRRVFHVDRFSQKVSFQKVSVR